MRLAVDASVLVAELPRIRGQRLITNPAHDMALSEHGWSEVTHELPRRLEARERNGRLALGGALHLYRECIDIVRLHIRVVPVFVYQRFELLALRRVPRDPRDWPTVALALALEAGIWTADADFLGCDVPTWTT